MENPFRGVASPALICAQTCFIEGLAVYHDMTMVYVAGNQHANMSTLIAFPREVILALTTPQGKLK